MRLQRVTTDHHVHNYRADDPITLQGDLDVLRERQRLATGGGSGPRNTGLRALLVYLAARQMLALEAYDRECSRG